MEKFFSHVFTDRLTVFSGIRTGSLETTSLETSGIFLDSYNYWYPISGLHATSIVTTLLNSISGIFSTITANNVSLNNDISLSGNIYLPYTRCPSPSGIIYKNGVPFIHDYCAECDEVGINLYCNNLFIGENAGNFIMGQTATSPWHASNNIGIGYETLRSNTLGSSNIAIGNRALKNSTTGDGNIAIGRGVLFQSTDADYNVVIGSNAGNGGAFGDYNVAIGRSTLYHLDGGNNNVALGAYAGYKLADGITPLTSLDQSILLGYKAKPYANGDTNEIVIGYDATGHGSNTVTLGNEDITQTILRGNIGIGGITNPSYSLEVSGISKFWSNVHIYNTLYMNADILPSSTVTRSLGSSSLRWKDIYTSNTNTETINDFITINSDSSQIGIGCEINKIIEKLTINGDLGLRNGALWQPIYPSDDGLVLYFPFSEGMGTKVHDKSPSGNDGEIYEATWTDGKFGRALYFNGSSSYIKTEENGPSGTGVISYGCWIKTSQTGNNKHILNIGTPVTNGMAHLMLHGGKIKYGAWGFDCFSNGTYNDGKWHYIVVVYNKSNFKLYVDGVLESSSSSYSSLNITPAPIYIGKYCNADGFEFNGIIDEIRIYNRVLSEEEIKAHYLCGLQSHGYVMANNFKIINTSAQELVRVTFSDEGSMVGIGTDNPSTTLDVSGIIRGTNLELVSGIIYPSADSTTAIQINKADGTTNIVNIDTTNRRVGIGVTSPNAKLEVAGRIYQSSLGYSTFIGYEAGKNDDLSSNTNTAVGYQSMYSNTSGYRNTSMGAYSLYSNTTGYFNVAVGVRALYSNTTGTDNIAIGNSTLRLNETGSFNIAIGRDALYNNTSNNNIAIGFTALRSNTTGSNNTVIGYAAGYNSTGNSNVFIGHKAGYNETGSNKLYIANSDTSNPLIYGEFDNDTVKINDHLVVNEDLKLECVTTLPTASSEQEGKLIYHCWSETIGKDILYHRDLVFCVKTGTSSYTWETIVNKSWTESA